MATPVISKMTISEDNQINTTEATQEVAVSGSVSGARDKDVVKVYLGNKEIGSGEVFRQPIQHQRQRRGFSSGCG